MRTCLAVLLATGAFSAFSQPASTPERPIFMFVQTASSGSLTPVDGKPSQFTLTLEGVAPQTVYFSDRPLREVGQVPNEIFLEALGFEDDNPPNAAVEIAYGKQAGDIVVVELRNPVYHPRAGTLRYDVTVLSEAKGGLAFYSKRADSKLPHKFAAVSLFIDDCPDGTLDCTVVRDDGLKQFCGEVKYGRCWDWKNARCRPCHNPGGKCNEQLKSCCKNKCDWDED